MAEGTVLPEPRATAGEEYATGEEYGRKADAVAESFCSGLAAAVDGVTKGSLSS